jgi:hypothetical protein
LFTLKKDLKIIQPLETSMMHALTQSTTWLRYAKNQSINIEAGNK